LELEFLAFLSFVPEAVITGAAGNFGAVCARMMAAEGAKLALVDLVEDRELVEKLPISKVFKAFKVLLKLVVQHS
jgi:NAD(P)-dependent dehydrogenase (short-subunit alcohol dehydrogenase family)